jgi:hypothetical protein
MSTIADRGNAATDSAAFGALKTQIVAQSTRSIWTGKIDHKPLAMSR